MSSNCVLVDIDGTIYDANTTFDFFDYYFKCSWKYRWFRWCSKTFIGRAINKTSITVCGYDMIRGVGVKWLKGYSKESLANMAETFYNNFLQNKIHRRIVDIINEEKIAGKKVILASATLDFISELIKNKIGADGCISTELYYENDVCRGSIKYDRLGYKEAALIKLGVLFPVYKTITDNVTDCNILQKSENCVVIEYPKERKKWNRLIKTFSFSKLCILEHNAIV